MRRLKSYPLIAIAVLSICSAYGLGHAIKAVEELGKITIVSAGIELVEVTPRAEKCNDQKGQTLRLKVSSENPVDVRLYAKVRRGEWFPKDFLDQKKGDEIVDYRCDGNRDYKVYAHAAGNSEAWPKP